RLAADAVAVMPENRSTHRARDKADGIDRKGLERADPWVGVREEQFGKDQARDGRIEEEIVPLDRGTDGGGDHGAPKLNLVVGSCEGDGIGGYGHGRSPGGPNRFIFFGKRSGRRRVPPGKPFAKAFSPAGRSRSRQM